MNYHLGIDVMTKNGKTRILDTQMQIDEEEYREMINSRKLLASYCEYAMGVIKLSHKSVDLIGADVSIRDEENNITYLDNTDLSEYVI